MRANFKKLMYVYMERALEIESEMFSGFVRSPENKINENIFRHVEHRQLSESKQNFITSLYSHNVVSWGIYTRQSYVRSAD